MKTADILKMNDEELVHAELRAERELVGLNVQKALKQLENHAQLKRVRRSIARYRTIQRQREIERGLPAEALKNLHARSFKVEAVEKEEKPSESKGFLKGIVDKIRGA